MKQMNVTNETNKVIGAVTQMERTEKTELRTANRKIYENADHTMTAEIFLEPVHYQDTDGSWKEMDDTLVEAEEEKDSENTSKDLENTKGDWNVKFHNKVKKNGTISLKKGSRQLSWTPEDAAKVKGEKSGPSEVIYPNIYEGVDLHVRIHGEKK